MPEHIEKLKATLAELEAELRGLDSLDSETREVLDQAARDIDAALDRRNLTDIEQESLAERLNDSARQFEGSHPTLAGILKRLIDGLGGLGI